MTKPSVPTPADVVEIDAMDVAEWESGQRTPQTSDANLAELVRRSAKTPEPMPTVAARPTAPKAGHVRAQTAVQVSGRTGTAGPVAGLPSTQPARTEPPKAAPKPTRARTEVAFGPAMTPPAGTSTSPVPVGSRRPTPLPVSAAAQLARSDPFDSATATYDAPARALAEGSGHAAPLDPMAMPAGLQRELARASSPLPGSEAGRTWLPLPAPSDAPSEPHRLVPALAPPRPDRLAPLDVARAPDRLAPPDAARAPDRLAPLDAARAPDRLAPLDAARAPDRPAPLDAARAPDRPAPPRFPPDQTTEGAVQLSVGLTRRRLWWIAGTLSAVSLAVVIAAAVIAVPGETSDATDEPVPAPSRRAAQVARPTPVPAAPGSAAAQPIARSGPSAPEPSGARIRSAGDFGLAPAATAPPLVEPRSGAGQPVKKTGGKKLVIDYAVRPSDAPAPGLVAQSEEDPAIGRARNAYTIGNQKLFSGDIDGAIEAYYQALDFYPGYVGGYRGLGLAYAQLGVPTRAVTALKTYVEAAPNARDVPLIRKRIARLQGK
jgi:hypothetical protein